MIKNYVAFDTAKSSMAILAKPLIILGALVWILSAYLAQPLIIGEEVFERWNSRKFKNH